MSETIEKNGSFMLGNSNKNEKVLNQLMPLKSDKFALKLDKDLL